MFKKLFNKIVGDPNRKVIEKLVDRVDEVNAFEPELADLSNEELRERTQTLRDQITAVVNDTTHLPQDDQDAILQDALQEILPEGYALVREASRRTTGLRHYDVQIMGGILLNRGEIVEQRTGEGKTLVATLPLFLNALSGRGVHLVTVNEYLVRRDGGWMGNIFHFLGLSVACIGPQQFSALYDPEYINPGAELEDERLVHWRPCTRREAYRADITYGTSSEFGFDYLRDNMVYDEQNLVQRPLFSAIIDEVDNVLIDEARTPLIISGPAQQASDDYKRFSTLVKGLKRNTVDDEDAEPDGHYDLDEKSRSVTLTTMGVEEIERRVPEVDDEMGESLYDPQHYQLTYYLENALKAEYLFKRDVDYTVHEGEVVIIDDFTGRLMPGRRYSDGLHEAIEAKEKVQIQRESVTVATITIQNYFRLYRKIAGMTGTAMTDAEEFQEIYKVEVTPLPTNVTYMAEYARPPVLDMRKEKDDGIEVTKYYEHGRDTATYFKRIDFADQVFASEDLKDKAIVEEIIHVAQTGRPVLVGTTSVEHSEKINAMLRRAKVEHKVLNAKMHESEALVVAQAGRRGAVTISTNMAGRGTDILLGGNPEGLAAEYVENKLFNREAAVQLAQVLLQEGADKARSMADRQPRLSPDLVDRMVAIQEEYNTAASEIEKIQVVGYLAQQFADRYDMDYADSLSVVQEVQTNRLNRARTKLTELNQDTVIADEAVRLFKLYTDYQMALKDERRMAQFLGEQMFDEHYTARAAVVRAVLGGNLPKAEKLTKEIPALPYKVIEDIQEIVRNTAEERKKVWELGGLHVVGSERHESRRIDNQLRGRAARQGDPGSSRFFLSLEDELMRRFGGERLRSFMTRNVPDDLPIESGVLDRLISSSQERLEGYNFDIRKNVLEYDDVMAKQRETIYNERRRILTSALDSEERITDAFALVIDELVTNYMDNYQGFVREEIDRTITNFSTDATGYINVRGVLRQMRVYLPTQTLDWSELENVNEAKLRKELMRLAQINEQEGRNLLQLLQAMKQFVPVIPAVPPLANYLIGRRTGHLQTRATVEKDFLQRLREIYDAFLSNYVDGDKREAIWHTAVDSIEKAFADFNVQRVTREALKGQQIIFQERIDTAVQDLLLDSLATLASDQLVQALNDHVTKQRDIWRKRIGNEEYDRFKRTMLLQAIDNEWRDYLTAADDLRREIGLESAGRQRDPKVEYKVRSFEMFSDMRNNIEKDIATRFFQNIVKHEAYTREQAAAAQKQLQMNQAGYQVVQRQQGKGTELRREVPKVGRNDLCPCGSGKKYKQCHGRVQRTKKPTRTR